MFVCASQSVIQQHFSVKQFSYHEAYLYSELILQICNGVETDKTESQYVNLGDLSDACITRPVTCGGEGATVSLWLKVEHCGTNDGALFSSDYYYDGGATPREGFIVSCFTTGMRYTLYDPCPSPGSNLFHIYFLVT